MRFPPKVLASQEVEASGSLRLITHWDPVFKNKVARELKTKNSSGAQLENKAEGLPLKLPTVQKHLAGKGNPLKKQKMRRNYCKAVAMWGKAAGWSLCSDRILPTPAVFIRAVSEP